MRETAYFIKDPLDSLQDLQTKDRQPHEAWLEFQERGGMGAVLGRAPGCSGLGLQRVIKVRESQMAVELQPLPLENGAGEILLFTFS